MACHTSAGGLAMWTDSSTWTGALIAFHPRPPARRRGRRRRRTPGGAGGWLRSPSGNRPRSGRRSGGRAGARRAALDEPGQRDVDAAVDVLLAPLASRCGRRARRGCVGRAEPLGQNGRCDALGGSDELGVLLEGPHAALQIAADDVEADPSEPHRCLLLAPRLRDDGHRRTGVEDRPAPGGVAAAEADVEAARQVGGLEVGRIARVEDRAALLSQLERLAPATAAAAPPRAPPRASDAPWCCRTAS